jgi:HSP20 family protein
MYLNDWRFAAFHHPLSRFAQAIGELSSSTVTPGESADDAIPVNLWAGQDELLLTYEIPGVNGHSVQVDVHGDILAITGQRDPAQVDAATPAHTQDGGTTSTRSASRVSRTVKLPYRVDSQRTTASLHNGILSVSLHRPNADKPHRITVTTT